MQRFARLSSLIEQVRATNRFQQRRLAGVELRSIDDLRRIPLTSKHALVADQQTNPPFGTNLTFEPERYTHLHQTSGTSRATLRVLDTTEDWDWWGQCFAAVFKGAGVGPQDRIAMAYSFGPYVQFWASYEGAGAIGALALALGGMDSIQRLETIREYTATTVMCTPSYAVHLARTAAQNGLGEALQSVDKVLCTGEPGASLPAVRAAIEAAYGKGRARCFDHAGISEVGSFGYPCDAAGGIHLLEEEFIAEILDPESAAPVDDGGMGELVITALGRVGFPAIRYCTGDLVEANPEPCPAAHPGRWLPGGIVGRSDEMVVIRGMNVFPSAIEQVLREYPGVGEFRITFYSEPTAMDEVKVEVELAQPCRAREIQARLRQRLGLRIRIVPLKPGILPVQMGKAHRVLDIRPVRPRTLDEV
jgi:phenylacetate-CoA ligase